MNNYELTERGKIIIAVILVLLLLVLPSTILVVLAWDNTPPPTSDPPHTSEPDPDNDSSVISDRPLPDGSGFNPDDSSVDTPADTPPDNSVDTPDDNSIDTPSDDDSESGSFDPLPEQLDEVPEYGPVSINNAEGTMLFIFAPGLQDALDDMTVSMLGEFITSPKNTVDAVILIEIPLLSEENTTILISAIADAFAKHGVTQSELAYVVYQSDKDETTYEVTLSFYDDPNRK